MSERIVPAQTYKVSGLKVSNCECTRVYEESKEKSLGSVWYWPESVRWLTTIAVNAIKPVEAPLVAVRSFIFLCHLRGGSSWHSSFMKSVPRFAECSNNIPHITSARVGRPQNPCFLSNWIVILLCKLIVSCFSVEHVPRHLHPHIKTCHPGWVCWFAWRWRAIRYRGPLCPPKPHRPILHVLPRTCSWAT